MSDTPETDAFREVVFAQYKEDELTGDGMGNILAALTNIETLERKRECECKCDVDWPEEYYELRQRLEIERDELREQLKSERALADWLADCLNNLWQHHSLTEASYDYIDNALAAWKEARGE